MTLDQRIANVLTWKRGAKRAPHKPLLLLLAIGNIQRGGKRLQYFEDISKENQPKYDAIIIDEGQDFKPEWYEYLQTLLQSRTESHFSVFLDEHQDIFGHWKRFDALHTPLSRLCFLVLPELNLGKEFLFPFIGNRHQGHVPFDFFGNPEIPLAAFSEAR